MGSFRFRVRPGDAWTINEFQYVASKRIGSKLVFESPQSSEPLLFDDQELTQLWLDGRAERSPVPRSARTPEMAALSDEDLAIVRRKRRYIDAWHNAPWGTRSQATATALIQKVADEIGDANSPKKRTVQSWCTLWLAHNRNDGALAPSRGERRRPRLHPLLHELIDTVVERYYLDPQELPLTQVHAYLGIELKRLKRENPVFDQIDIALPSRSTLRRHIKRLSQRVVMAARKGEDAARRHFDIAMAGPRLSRPLQNVLMDTKYEDIIAVDPDGKPATRIYITVLLDDATRVVLGLCISLDPPSWATVFQALRNAMLSKTYVSVLYPEIRNTWPCFGKPEQLQGDCGVENINRSLPSALGYLEIDATFDPAGNPEQKGKIERFLRTLSQETAHLLPGTTRSNPKQRGNHNPVASAAISLEEYRRIVHHWVIDIYHQRIHGALGCSPIEAWNKALQRFDILPPPNERDLTVLLGQTEKRTLQHYGIDFYGGIYRAPELGRLRKKPGERREVTVKFDPTDISKIWVVDDERRELIPALADDQDYTRFLSLYHHKLNLKRCAKAKREAGIEMSLGEAHAAIMEEYAPAKRRKKKTNRLAARLANTAGSMPFGEEARPRQQTVPTVPDETLFADELPKVAQPTELGIASRRPSMHLGHPGEGGSEGSSPAREVVHGMVSSDPYETLSMSRYLSEDLDSEKSDPPRDQ